MGISKGKIADIQLFDRLLTKEEMLGMTTCPGKKLIGNIINSTVPYSLYGPHVKDINITEEEICPVRNFSAVFFNAWHWSTWTSQEICRKIGMEVAFIANQEDMDNILFYFQNIFVGFNSWLQTTLHKREDGSWVDMHTNETTILH